MWKIGTLGGIARIGLLCAAVMVPGALPWSGAHAQFLGSSTPRALSTVAEANNAPKHARVTLTGNLTKEVGRARYVLQDETGTIRVRIEREFWRGREVTNKSTLKVMGRTDSDVRGRFVDVYYFDIID